MLSLSLVRSGVFADNSMRSLTSVVFSNTPLLTGTLPFGCFHETELLIVVVFFMQLDSLVSKLETG